MKREWEQDPTRRKRLNLIYEENKMGWDPIWPRFNVIDKTNEEKRSVISRPVTESQLPTEYSVIVFSLGKLAAIPSAHVLLADDKIIRCSEFINPTLIWEVI